MKSLRSKPQQLLLKRIAKLGYGLLQSIFQRDPARQPRAASLLTSNCFFGVPSGLLASQWISPRKPVAAATASASWQIVRSTPVPTFRNCSSSGLVASAPGRTRRLHRDHPHVGTPAVACRFPSRSRWCRSAQPPRGSGGSGQAAHGCCRGGSYRQGRRDLWASG